MSAGSSPHRITVPDPAWDRRAAVVKAITTGLGPGSLVIFTRRNRAADAVLEALADGGYLAPLPGERDQQITAYLADVEAALDRKLANRG